MRGVEIMEQMMPGTKEKILSGQFKVRDADMHRLARADFPNRKQIVHEILHPEDRSAPQKRIYGINYSALEAAVRYAVSSARCCSSKAAEQSFWYFYK